MDRQNNTLQHSSHEFLKSVFREQGVDIVSDDVAFIQILGKETNFHIHIVLTGSVPMVCTKEIHFYVNKL